MSHKRGRGLPNTAPSALIHPSEWKENTANFALTAFPGVRQGFIADSLPSASIGAT